MTQITGKCDRCRKPSNLFRCSWFNTENICPHCQGDEEAHPRFQEARDAENAAVLRGDLNFPGIGWPPESKGAKLSDLR